MKLKQCALALAALLCMSLCTISGAYAAEGPVFSMDLSAYSNTAPVIKNAAAGGATDGITFKGANNTSGNPQLAVYDSTNGSTPYLTFTDPENVTNAGRYGSFQIEQSKLTELGITDSDALTVEWWGKTYSGADGKPITSKVFKYGWTSMDRGYMEIYSDPGKTFSMRASGNADATGWWQAANLSVAADLDSWHHYVWTREWNSATSQWTTTLYKDGAVVAALNGVKGGYKLPETESGTAFAIGSQYNGYNVYGGGIGLFNIYTRALGAAEAANCYAATKDSFTAPLPKILADDDLSAYTVGGQPTGTAMFTQSRTIEHDMSDLTVCETTDASGGKLRYIQMANGGSSAKDTYYGWRFSPVFSESFVVDIDMQIDGISPMSRGIRWGKSTIIHDLRSAPSAEVDANGFYNFRYLFLMGADGKYDMTVIDRLTGATVATKADIGSTCEYLLCQQYDTPGNGKYLNVAKFKVYRYTLPEIASHNGGSLTLDDEVLKLGFSEALSVDSVKDEAFTLTNSDTGRTVLTALDGYDAESKTVSLKLREYLDAENHYSLAVSGVQNEEGFAVADGTAITFTAPADEARVTDVTFKNAAGEPITALGTEKNVSATAAVYGSLMQTRTYTMYVLLRDAEGTVVDVAAGTAQGVGNVNVSAALKGNVTVGEGYSVQCLVWENTDMGYRALQQAANTLR